MGVIFFVNLVTKQALFKFFLMKYIYLHVNESFHKSSQGTSFFSKPWLKKNVHVNWALEYLSLKIALDVLK